MLRYYLSLSDFDKFGIIIQQVGHHSLRASMAMALHLKGHPPYTIKYLGRWASEAFLLYLRIHIEEFNRHLSESMITDSSFHLIPKPTHLLPIPQPNNGPTLQGDIDNQCFHVWDFSGSNAWLLSWQLNYGIRTITLYRTYVNSMHPAFDNRQEEREFIIPST